MSASILNGGNPRRPPRYCNCNSLKECPTVRHPGSSQKGACSRKYDNNWGTTAIRHPSFAYDSVADFLERCLWYVRWVDISADYRRILLLLLTLPLFCIYLTSFLFFFTMLAIGAPAEKLYPELFQSGPQGGPRSRGNSRGGIFDFERHSYMRSLLHRRNPLFICFYFLYILDALLFTLLVVLWLICGMFWMITMATCLTVHLFPPNDGNETQYLCCKCFTGPSGAAHDFSFAAKACPQCKLRDKEWIWVKCTDGRGEEWRRVVAETGQIIPPNDSGHGRILGCWRVLGRSDNAVADIESGALVPRFLNQVPELAALRFPEHIAAFPACALQVSTLTSLNFESCRHLESLPLEGIMRLPSLTDLNCKDCTQLWNVPQEICNQGGEALISFLGQIRDNKGSISDDMALFLVGDGEAGKTSLLAALKSGNDRAFHIRTDHRTVGIDMSSWRPAGAGICFQVYDLAGQPVYVKTHQFFLLRRAVYVYVWRACASGVKGLRESIKDWLHGLQVRIPGAFVLLAVTHIDVVDAVTLNAQCREVQAAVRDLLRAMEGTVKLGSGVLKVLDQGESVRVNCLTGEGVPALRERIVIFAKSMPWYGQLLPQSWLKVQSQLQSLASAGEVHWLTQADFDSIVAQVASDIGDQLLQSSAVSAFFNDTGIIRVFGDTVYISVTWIMNIIKGLMRHDRQAMIDFFVSQQDKRMLQHVNRLNLCGVLHKDLVPYLWPAMPESRAFWGFVRQSGRREDELWEVDLVSQKEASDLAIKLLGGFNLLKEHGNELIVPGVLPPASLPQTPRIDVPGCPYRRLLRYSVLPPGAFHTLVVRIARTLPHSLEFGSSFAIASLDSGHVVQIFCLRVSKASRGVLALLGAVLQHSAHASSTVDSEEHIIVRSSSKELFRKVCDELTAVEGRFPGLVRLGTEDKPVPKDPRVLDVAPPLWSGRHEGSAAVDIPCGRRHPAGAVCGHVFHRRSLGSAWSQRAVSEDFDMELACPQCAHRHRLFDLLTVFQVTEVRRCPCCLVNAEEGKRARRRIGEFNAGECRLKVRSAHCKTVMCSACLAAGRLGLIPILDVASPEVFVSGLSTIHSEKRAAISGLLREVEAEADVICGNACGDSEYGPQCRLEEAFVVVVLLSDAYVRSPDCRAEFAAAVRFCKALVPVLMPATGLVAADGQSGGWTGQAEPDTQFWSHASALCRSLPSGSEQPAWSFLGKFVPLQFRPPSTDQVTDQEEAVPRSLPAEIALAVGKHLRRPGRVDVYSDFSMLGVKLSFFHVFVEMLGGRKAFENLTTVQVMTRFVLEATRESRLSYCDQLVADGTHRSYVARAEWFYSHTWAYLFLDVVDAAARFFARHCPGEDPVVWFDVFSVSQHKAEARPFEWWSSVFLNNVGAIGKVLMLMQPLDDETTGIPAWITLTRVWCVFEIYASESTLSQFEVTMTERIATSFRQATLDNDPALARLVDIDCERAVATSPADRERVLQVIRLSVGFPLLNSMVLHVMEKWLFRELCCPLVGTEISADDGRILQTVVGLLQRCLVRRESLPGIGKGHPDTLHTMHMLAGLYKTQGQHITARELHVECLRLRRAVLGDSHSDTLESVRTLAELYPEYGEIQG